MVVILSARTRFIRWRESSFSSPSQPMRVALLTPALPQMRAAIEAENVRAEDDPFECLGKAIIVYTMKVTHTPYLPSTYVAGQFVSFIDDADFIIVVKCRPSGMGDDEATNFLRDQDRFLDFVSRTSRGKKLCCVLCNTDGRDMDVMCENVVFCETYEERDMRSAAELLFGGNATRGPS
jgi:hypothetical protein